PEPSPQHPSHTFHPDNLLQVHPGSRHPILDLTEPMEKKWNAQLAHTSETLPEQSASTTADTQEHLHPASIDGTLLSSLQSLL
ncbi:hypothetical protein BDR06DRAFT_1050359, partial [Suillus hirtellus]